MDQSQRRPFDRNDTRPKGRGAESFAKLYERPLPYSAEAEMGLLGAMLLDPKVTPDVLGLVNKPEQFFEARHGLIFHTLVEVYDSKPDADLIPIVDALRVKGHLDDIGGQDYLLRLAQDTPSPAGAKYYAKLVADKHRLRRLIEAADGMIYAALNSGDYGLDATGEIIDLAEKSVFDIAQESQTADPQELAALLQKELERLEKADGKSLLGLATGFHDLDEKLLGLQKGDLLILAARPSMGKTALALNLAEQIARGGRTPESPQRGAHAAVGVFSLEMSKASLVQRLLSAFSGVSGQRLRTGELTATERATIKTCAEGLEDTPLFIDDTPGLTILQLRTRARRMVTQHAVQCIVIDYLQLLTAPGSARESRQAEVSAISRGIKALAKELEVPVLCLAQLNRASEQREGNRPRMSDLRESGSIEQDADVVLLLHREDYYHRGEPAWNPEHPEFNEENRDKIGTAELIIAKQRNGPTGTVQLTWDAATTRFKSHSSMPDSAVPYSSGGSYGADFGNPFDRSVEPKPAPRASGGPTGFPSSPKSGPISNHRDGGGPDRGGGMDEELPPF
jgi:replicative DNA helicase